MYRIHNNRISDEYLVKGNGDVSELPKKYIKLINTIYYSRLFLNIYL